MEQIIQYFVKEKETTKVVAEVLARTLVKYEDIQLEFLYWLEHRTYKQDNPISIEGYTAQDIQNLVPTMDVSGVYNFMVTLREKPQEAHEYIKTGFATK